MSCRFAATASTYGIKVYISYVGATDGRPLFRHKSNTVGGHSICPRCMEFHSNNAAAHFRACPV